MKSCEELKQTNDQNMRELDLINERLLRTL